MLDYIWSVGDGPGWGAKESTTKAGMSLRISELRFCLVLRHHQDHGIVLWQGVTDKGFLRIAGDIERFTITKDVCLSRVSDIRVWPPAVLVQARDAGCRRE